MTALFSLLAAHILADFYWQPTKWVTGKRRKVFRSKYLYYHIAVVFITSYVLLGNWRNPLPAIFIAILHAVIDIIKLKFDTKNTTTWFVSDQIMHVISILFVVGIITGQAEPTFETVLQWLQMPKSMALLTGLLLCLNPVSYMVGMMTRPWRQELERLVPNADDNLANAGRWIGISERLLIFIFVLISQFSAIGFLIAAKSLLRYNDKSSNEIPAAYITKKSEYVLVGTLLSYTSAIIIALLTKIFQ